MKQIMRFLLCSMAMAMLVFCVVMLIKITQFLVEMADMVKEKFADLEPKQPQSGLVDIPTVGTYDPRFQQKPEQNA